jgi:actin-like protein 6A
MVIIIKKKSIGCSVKDDGMLQDDSQQVKRYFHFDIANFRENMSICNPTRDGLVADWNLLEEIWQYSLAKFVKVDIKETPVLLAEKPYTSSESRRR